MASSSGVVGRLVVRRNLPSLSPSRRREGEPGRFEPTTVRINQRGLSRKHHQAEPHSAPQQPPIKSRVPPIPHGTREIAENSLHNR